MERRGLSAQGLHDAMVLEPSLDAVPSRATIDRILTQGAVPQARYRGAIAQFFELDTDRIWRVARTERAKA